MKTLSEIEKRLLDAELKIIQGAILGCMNQLKTVLTDLPHASKKDLKEIHEWVMESCKLDIAYGAGGWKLAPQQPSVDTLPESFKEAVLKKATDKFFERIEGIEEIVQDLEDRV